MRSPCRLHKQRIFLLGIKAGALIDNKDIIGWVRDKKKRIKQMSLFLKLKKGIIFRYRDSIYFDQVVGRVKASQADNQQPSLTEQMATLGLRSPKQRQATSSREYQSMLVRVNQLTGIITVLVLITQSKKIDKTLLLVSSKTCARRLGKARDANVSPL